MLPTGKGVMKYIKYKAHKRGIPNGYGGVRSCMHCNKQATTSAVKKNGHLTMDVWFCDEHTKVAKDI